MRNKDVIVLGSGMSVLNLSEAEIEYINQCSVRIAVNKFAAFYKKVNIIPTHIYYVDSYETSVILFLKHIFQICRNDKLENLTFILNKNLNKKNFLSNKLHFYLKKQYRIINNKDLLKLFLIPHNCNLEFISHQDWLTGDKWSDNLEEPLFHYRGGLSTVLNYVSVKYPNHPIRLVGVDFNSPCYFFQEELEKLNFSWQDRSTPITKQERKHFSAIPYEGTTIFDKFDFIIENLKFSGNEIFSCNPKSMLVTKNLVEYKKLLV